MKTFTLTDEQVAKFETWRKKKNKKNKGEIYVGAVGGAYTYCITPTGIGDLVVVKCADGTEIDLTEYEHF